MATEQSERMDSIVSAMLQACSDGNLEAARGIIAGDPIYASQQDQVTGRSPLMVAGGAGHLELCRLLLEHGAPWNAVDRNGQCAGNYATDAEHWEIVNLLVDAGTRAELILGASIRLQRQQDKESGQGLYTFSGGKSEELVEHQPYTKPDYLRKPLEYSADGTSLLDSDKDAVMMEWERPLMEAHASILMEGPERRVLNIGFGMGIIDSALQKRNPSLHIIIEAHPDVYSRMLKEKWNEKPNVRVCFGTWQDVVPKLIQEGIIVDGIFYDTYGEHFLDLEDFHASMVHLLSKPAGVYSFFNGLAPDNIFFHGVACQCVKLQLAHIGLDTEFIPCQIQVPDEGAWDGIRRKYWHGRDIYYLPRATWNDEFLSQASSATWLDAIRMKQKASARLTDPDDASKRQKLESA